MVEIGCGIGDIIGNLDTKQKKYGFDLSSEAIDAAKKLHKDTHFECGSFGDVAVGNISFLIMVNFIHALSQAELYAEVQKIFDRNKIQYICMDVVERIKYSEYKTTHNGIKLFDDKYKRIYRGIDYIAAHGAKRHIEIWQIKGEEM